MATAGSSSGATGSYPEKRKREASPPASSIREDHACINLALSHTTMDALKFFSFGHTEDTLLLAYHDHVQYSGAYVIRCILRKKFLRLHHFVIEAHHEPGRILVRCYNKAVIRRLYTKYIQQGVERVSFFKVAKVSHLLPDPLDEDLQLENF